MANTLGLSFFFHDSAAALVCDGKLVAAAAEERFSRRKHTNEFPKQAIEYALEAGGLSSINDLDAIIFYEKPVIKFQRIIESVVETWPQSLFTFSRKMPGFLKSKLQIADTIREHLPGYQGEILFSEHHLSHAASAFYCSPYDEAAILTIDGVGERETTTLGVGRGRKIELIKSLGFPHSLGLLYAALTSFLGFKVNDGEWKVMGLSPYGRPIYVDKFRKLVRMKPDGSFALDMTYFAHHFSSRWAARNKQWEKLFGFPRRDPKQPLEQRHSDLAHSGQAVVEELILNLAREAQRVTGLNKLVIAGGVGLNGVANWKIERDGIFKHVWIQPAPGDDGAAVGAALLASQDLFNDPLSQPMAHAYLGPAFSNQEIGTYLQREAIPAEFLDDKTLLARTTELLAQGKVVGWFQGRMEFGPRALGSRSILADARDPGMKDTVNSKIKYREHFRPFAPVVPLENVSEFFEVPPLTELPFMVKVLPVREEMKARIPAVTHADGSARVQTVTAESNPRLHELLKAFGERTGVPVLLNTSFNVRGEPIVCSPADAYRCFLGTGIDVLVLGNYLLTTKPGEEDAAVGYRRSDALEKDPASTTDTVLRFYQELPFNFYSNAVDTASELTRSNRLKAYPSLVRYLKTVKPKRVIDVGCGAGWFLNSSAHYHGVTGLGIDLNAQVLKQARSVARLLASARGNRFEAANLFEYQPSGEFDLVNSLGVLHHTVDCRGAVRRLSSWLAPGGYFHLGLYHSFGRRPFLEHFENLKTKGVDEQGLYEEFRRLNPEMTDQTHLRSWFRDQVIHPHETQHSFAEVAEWLEEDGLILEATSINHFRALPSRAELARLEREYEKRSRKALHGKGVYFPGFFVVWARKPLAV